jgi:hypothetical protein
MHAIPKTNQHRKGVRLILIIALAVIGIALTYVALHAGHVVNPTVATITHTPGKTPGLRTVWNGIGTYPSSSRMPLCPAQSLGHLATVHHLVVRCVPNGEHPVWHYVMSAHQWHSLHVHHVNHLIHERNLRK